MIFSIAFKEGSRGNNEILAMILKHNIPWSQNIFRIVSYLDYWHAEINLRIDTSGGGVNFVGLFY